MPVVKPREKIKKRFIQAVDAVTKDHYPQMLQVDIIKSLGFAPSNYYRLRSGSIYPTLDQCFVLCTKYKISADWLVKGEGAMKYIDVKKAGPIELIKAAVAALESGKSINKTRNKTPNK